MTDTPPAPAAPERKPVDDTLAWAVALVPGATLLLSLVTPADLTLPILLANVGLATVDTLRLKEAGYGTLGGWTVLVPVYLAKRAQLVGRGRGMVAVWMVLFASGIVMPGFVARGARTEVACELVTEILQREDKAAPSCKGVTVTTDPGTGFVKGTALLSDGSEREITIEMKGDSVEVQVLPR